MENQNTESNSVSEILDIIPESVRRIIGAGNLTEANYLTRTLTPAGQVQVMTPGGQTEVSGINLNQIAMDFDSALRSQLPAVDSPLLPDSFKIPPVLRQNSLKSSEVDQITNPFPFALTTPITTDYSLDKAKVFTDANQQSLFDRISGASSGAQQDKFFDADDADNLIQIKAADATQLGGLRAWGGNDQILGNNDSNIVNANAGNDEIVGVGGDDLLRGAQGNDRIAGGEGNDLLLGNKGDDELFGGEGDDVLKGGRGADILIGNGGNDMLIAGGGEEGDFLMGSAGADQFILGAETLAKYAAEANRIVDFNPSEGDLIKIAYFEGTLAVPQITFATVDDVNLDTIQDTAILRGEEFVGVILGKASTPLDHNNLKSSIFMVNPKDTGLSMIG
jgi:Ca2+-binding RTX toxin-like protein